MVIPNLTHGVIEENSRPQSLDRGQDYFETGAVFSVTQRKQTVSSQVEGSEIDPYVRFVSCEIKIVPMNYVV